MVERERASLRLWHEIERDFEALVRLLERAIGSETVSPDEIESLTRAKRAAEKGAALTKKHLN